MTKIAPSMPGVRQLRIFTPFGVTFVDAALGRRVDEGLCVTARADGDPATVVAAYRTASAVYAFAGLPGMHDVEYPVGDDDPRQAPKRRFLIRVEDKWRRFLPAVFAAELPHDGLFPVPGSGLGGFFLFSAPTRPASPAFATVRAQIETVQGDAAAYALLEARLPGGGVRYGLADRRGAATLVFPWPCFDPPPLRSLQAVVAEQQWPLRLRVRHQPAALKRAVGIDEPLLGSVFAQEYAMILPAAPGSLVIPVLEREETLIHATELVLRSGDRLPLIVESAVAPSSIP